MTRFVASIEARLGSSRLPGKVLKDVQGEPALTRLLRRLRRCERLDDIVLATTTSSNDDELEAWAKDQDVAYYRGSEEDVLHRVVEAQRMMDSDIVVEVTGDSILLDPEMIDLGVRMYQVHDCDVVSSTSERSFPMGVNVQVFSLALLDEVERTVDDPDVREHVSLYFYEHPEIYDILHLMAPRRWDAPEYRFQLDYPEDLKFINEVYARLEPLYGDAFGIEEIMALLREEPELVDINIDRVERAPRSGPAYEDL